MLAAAAGLAFVLAAWAQNPPPQKDDQSVETFKVSVDVVNVFFNVKDDHGALIPGLQKDDFQIFEDGGPQTIKYFSAESNQPLTLGMLIDTSISQQRVLPMEKEIGAAFLREVLREKDLAFVISFDVDVGLLQDYTSNSRDLRAGLERAHINAGTSGIMFPGTGGNPVPNRRPRGTVLFDAVYLAADEMLSKEVGRKAVILLTDGADFGSRKDLRQAIEAAQRADVICYVLLVEDRSWYASQGAFFPGEGDVKKLTAETGGRVINVGSKPEKLKEAFDQIANELRSQYNLGYTPTNPQRDGGFRKIEIKSHKGYKIQARRGYYARTQ
ncbi:MAG: VWA domain-containing protein [Terriglobales bacterium]